MRHVTREKNIESARRRDKEAVFLAAQVES